MSNRRNKPDDRHEAGQLENHNFTPMLKSLYLKEEGADAFFVFTTADDQTERVPAHKLLLSNSENFAKLFADAEEGQTEFKIDGTTAEAFKEFLQFFYMPKFKLTFENIAGIMALAKDYGREGMLTECSIYLDNTLTTENIVWGYGLAIRFDRAHLKNKCEQKIADNAGDVFKSNCFLECEREVLSQILLLDSLKCEESQVLTSCLLWAKAAADRKGLDGNCTKVLREELGDLLHQIRFKSITIESFAMIVAAFKGLFSSDDLQEITLLIGLKDYKSETFDSKCRTIIGGSSNISSNNSHNNNNGAGGQSPKTTTAAPGSIGDGRFKQEVLNGNRFVGNSQTRHLIQKQEKTRFEAQKPLKLVGLTCSQIFNVKNDSKVNVDAKVIISEETADGKKPSEIFESCLTLCSERETNVPICCPIAIEPNRIYNVLVEFDNDPEFYNQLELRTLMELKNGVKIRFVNDPSKGYDDAKVGLVTKLQFKRA